MITRSAGHPARCRPQEVERGRTVSSAGSCAANPGDDRVPGRAVVAFKDITPQAPMHVLDRPAPAHREPERAHAADDELVGPDGATARSDRAGEGVCDRGYRTVFNSNADAGQTVFHIHLHLLAGAQDDAWPPG